MAEDLRQKIIIITDTKELKTLFADLNKVSAAGEKAGTAISKAGKKATKELSLAAKAGNKFKNAMGKLPGIFGRMARLGPAGIILGIAVAMGKAIRMAARFEKAFAEVRTLIDETEVSSGLLQAQLLQLSKVRPIGLLDLTGALYQLISAGIDATKAVKVLDIATKAAVAGLTTAEVAIDGITSVLKAWSLGADEAQRVSDAFFVSVRNGKTTFSELASVIGQLAPIAAATGVSIEEAFSAVTALTQAGVRTNLAATQVRSLLVAIARQVPQTVKVANQLGESFSITALRAKGLKVFLDDIVKAAKGDETQITKLVGRIEALQAILALTGAASKAFEKNLVDMAHKAGVTDLAFAKMEDTAANLTKIISGKLEVAFTELGLRILPSVNNALDGLIDLLERLAPSAQRALSALEGLTGIDPRIIAQLEILVKEEQIQEVLHKVQTELDSGKFEIPVFLKEIDEGAWRKFWRKLQTPNIPGIGGANIINALIRTAVDEAETVVVPGELIDLGELERSEGLELAAKRVKDLTREMSFLAQLMLSGGDFTDAHRKSLVMYAEEMGKTEEAIKSLLAKQDEAKTAGGDLSDADKAKLGLLREQETSLIHILNLKNKEGSFTEDEIRLTADRIALMKEAIDLSLAFTSAVGSETQALKLAANAHAERILAAGSDEDIENQTVQDILDEIARREEAFKDLFFKSAILKKDEIAKSFNAGLLLYGDQLEKAGTATDGLRTKIAQAGERGVVLIRSWGDQIAEASARMKVLDKTIGKADGSAKKFTEQIRLDDTPEKFRAIIKEIIEVENNLTEVGNVIDALNEREIAFGELSAEDLDLRTMFVDLQRDFAENEVTLKYNIGAAEGFDQALRNFVKSVSSDASSLNEAIIAFKPILERDPELLEQGLREFALENSAKAEKIKATIGFESSDEDRREVRRQVRELEAEVRDKIRDVLRIIVAFGPEMSQAVEAINKSIGKIDFSTPVSEEIDIIIDRYRALASGAAISLEMDIGFDDSDFNAAIQAAVAGAVVELKTLQSTEAGLTDENIANITEELLFLASEANNAASRLGDLGKKLDFAKDVLRDFSRIGNSIGGISPAITRLAGDMSRLVDATKFAISAFKALRVVKLQAAANNISSVMAGTGGVTSNKLPVAASISSAATIAAGTGVALAIGGFVSSLKASAKARREEERKNRKRMRDLTTEIKLNTSAIRDNLAEAFLGGSVAGGSTKDDIRRGQDVSSSLSVLSGVALRLSLDDINERVRGSFEDIFDAQKGAALEMLATIESLDFEGLSGLTELFEDTLERNGRNLGGALDAIMELLVGHFDRLLVEIGQSTRDIPGAIERLNALAEIMGVEGQKALDSTIAFLQNLDLGPAFKSFLVSITEGIDIDTEEGRAEFKKRLRLFYEGLFLTGDPALAAIFKDIDPDVMKALFDSFFGLVPDEGVDGLTSALDAAFDALGVFTGLLDGEGAAAFQFFIGKLLEGSDEFGKGLTDLLLDAQGIDVTTQEGQKRLNAIIQAIGQSILNGTAMDDFGIAAEDLEKIATELKSLGESGFKEGFSSSVSIARTITEIQGNEVIILLNEITHWTKRTAEAMESIGVPEVGVPSIPVGTSDFIAATGVVNASGFTPDANVMKGQVPNMINNWEFNIDVDPSVDLIMKEINTKVKSKMYQAFPKS